MEIKISVIIPVYNTEKYLEKCLNSVLKQTLKEIEIIIINDGSQDQSEKILERYNVDQRIIVINKSNEGVSKARNIGLKMSKGKYIYYLDSDDYIEENMLLEMYNKTEKENLDIVVCDYWKENFFQKEYVKNLDIKENEIILGKLMQNMYYIVKIKYLQLYGQN
ncbi:glycosyltransferase family 2 protein [Fusobacterium sp.]|uniref:glycosyltransferase family 2 protein n=1 Tax=Fusobacterium sp. TaxID=68766 RepID=UPI0029004988|nr:glycosyltransferase family 2 protein [Fusobacterium sp.]MDU1910875.1 glycosyltransferase family 2 protein [Fusobacterium sp.]